MSQTLVLNRGGFFRRYARAARISGGSYGSTDYFFSWRKAIASAGYFSDSVPQEIYVWNSLHKEWNRVATVSN